MNFMNQIVRLLLASAVVISTPLPMTANAQDEYTEFRSVGGEICNTRNPAVRGIRRKNAGLYNVHNENVYNISCPIVALTLHHIELEDPTSEIGIEPIFLNSHEAAQTVRCRLLLAHQDGTAERVDGASQTIGPGETDNLRLGVSITASVSVFQPLTLVCRLPPQAALLSLTFY